MIEAASYLRCSGESQVSGDTWERQQAAINKYADHHGITVVREFRDQGVTGKMELEGRAGLSACIQFVRENKIDLVLVESSDRLARDLIVAEVVVREFQKIGVRIVAAASAVDLTAGDDSNPTGKLIRQILAAVAEFDRCVTVLKLKGARDRIRLERGKCDGRKAFGEKPGEPQALARMVQFSRIGYTSQVIAEHLNSNGFKTRSGKPWRGTTVAKILARQKAA